MTTTPFTTLAGYIQDTSHNYVASIAKSFADKKWLEMVTIMTKDVQGIVTMNIATFLIANRMTFAGFDAVKTRTEIAFVAGKKGIAPDVFNEVVIGVITFAMEKGNRMDTNALNRMNDPAFIRNLFNEWNIKPKGNLKPTNWALVFPFHCYAIIHLGIHNDPTGADGAAYGGLDIGLRWSGGSSLCQTEVEFNNWVQWSQAFAQRINALKSPENKALFVDITRIRELGGQGYRNFQSTTLCKDRNEVFQIRQDIFKVVSARREEYQRLDKTSTVSMTTLTDTTTTSASGATSTTTSVLGGGTSSGFSFFGTG